MEANMSSDGQGPYVEDENTQDESSSENDSNPIFVLGNLCIERLTSLFDDQSLHEQQEVHPSLWQDELGRLRVWAASIGIHQSANSSSDKTLYNAFFVNDQILELLERLRRTVDDLQESLKGSEYGDDIEDELSDDSAESETELRSIYHAFRDTIDNLFQMSILTERPTRHDRSPTTDPSDSTAFSPIKVQHNLYKSFITAQASSIPKPTAFTSSAELGNEKEVSVPQPDDSSAPRYAFKPEKPHQNTIGDAPCSRHPDPEPHNDMMTSSGRHSGGPQSLMNYGSTMRSHVGESPNENPNEVNLRIRLVLELKRIFSVVKIRSDMRLQPHMDSQGFFPLSVVASLNPISALTTDIQLLSHVCQGIQFIEYKVSADGAELLRPRSMWHESTPSHELRDSLDQNRGSFITQAVQSSPAQHRLRRAREQLNINRSFDAHLNSESGHTIEDLPAMSQGRGQQGELQSHSVRRPHYASRQPTQVIVANSRVERPRSLPRYYNDLYGMHDTSQDSTKSVREKQVDGPERSSALVSVASASSPETADRSRDTDSHEDSGHVSETQTMTLSLNGMTLSFGGEVPGGKTISIRTDREIMQTVISSPILPVVKRQELDGYPPSSAVSIYSGTSGSSRYSSYAGSSRYSSSSDSTGRRELENLRQDQNDLNHWRSRRNPNNAGKMRTTGTDLTLHQISKDRPEVHPVVDHDGLEDPRSSIRSRLYTADKHTPFSRVEVPERYSEISRSTAPVSGSPGIILLPFSTHEQIALNRFEEHIAHCIFCPKALQKNENIVCMQGITYATHVADLLFSENGAYFSFHAHRGGNTGMVHIPDDAQAVRCLLVGVESGFFLPRRRL